MVWLWHDYDMVIKTWLGLPWWLSGKEFACQCRRCTSLGFDPWVWKITGEGNGNPLQYPCLRKPMDRRAWRAILHGVAEPDVTMWLTTSYTCCAVLCWVTQSYPALCNLMDCSPPGSSVHGNSPGKNTGRSSSRGSSQPTDRTGVSCIAGGFFTSWATREAPQPKISSPNPWNL